MKEHEVTTAGLDFLWKWTQAQPRTKETILVALLVVTTLRDRGEMLSAAQRLFLVGAEAAP